MLKRNEVIHYLSFSLNILSIVTSLLYYIICRYIRGVGQIENPESVGFGQQLNRSADQRVLQLHPGSHQEAAQAGIH